MTVSAAGARDDCEERFSTFSRLLRLLRTPSESAFEKASALACGMDQCPIPTSDFNSYACLLLGPLWSVTSTGCGASEVPAKVAVPDWWSPASSRYAYVQVLVLLPAAFCRSLWRQLQRSVSVYRSANDRRPAGRLLCVSSKLFIEF